MKFLLDVMIMVPRSYLPVAWRDELSRELKLLVDWREDLVGERTRMISRLGCTYTSSTPAWTRHQHR